MKTIMLLTYAFLGTYNLEVQIGDRTFIDILTISKTSENGEVSGTFEVPRVFNVPFSGQVTGRKLRGEFLAKEGGSSFKVELEATFKTSCELKGELLQDGIPFGQFLGTKENCHE
ncbi:MAG: hypothetical protein NXH75_06385 [Halobacteriovoraceae bacterium]|nr:hypothetical protein [Halobacteriovoraceae bacterium]